MNFEGFDFLFVNLSIFFFFLPNLVDEALFLSLSDEISVGSNTYIEVDLFVGILLR